MLQDGHLSKYHPAIVRAWGFTVHVHLETYHADNESQWKSFDFFDVVQINIADDETRQLFEGNEISSVCAGSDSLFLGSFEGYVSIINKSWKIVKRFQAYEAGSITHMRQVEGTSLLLTVAVRAVEA